MGVSKTRKLSLAGGKLAQSFKASLSSLTRGTMPASPSNGFLK